MLCTITIDLFKGLKKIVTIGNLVANSSSRGVVFRLQISPWIRSQNRNASKHSVRDLCQTGLCKNPRKSASLPCPFKYGGRSPKFIWAPCHVMCQSFAHWLRPRNPPPAIGIRIRWRYWSAKIDDISLSSRDCSVEEGLNDWRPCSWLLCQTHEPNIYKDNKPLMSAF